MKKKETGKEERENTSRQREPQQVDVSLGIICQRTENNLLHDCRLTFIHHPDSLNFCYVIIQYSASQLAQDLKLEPNYLG